MMMMAPEEGGGPQAGEHAGCICPTPEEQRGSRGVFTSKWSCQVYWEHTDGHAR